MTDQPKYNARETIYAGIKMRSRNEARYAAALDNAGLEWEYEPNAYADQSGQYLPDFKVALPDGRTLFIEVKGYDQDIQPQLDRMQPILASLPDALLAVVLPSAPSHLALVTPEWQGIARWCSWTKNGQPHVGPIHIWEREDERFDAIADLNDADPDEYFKWEAMQALVESFRLEIEDLQPIPFDWTWDG